MPNVESVDFDGNLLDVLLAKDQIQFVIGQDGGLASLPSVLSKKAKDILPKIIKMLRSSSLIEMKLINEIEKILEEEESVEGMIIRNEGWTVKVENKSKTFDKGGDSGNDGAHEIKAFLNKALHPNHNGSDFADDGAKYLFKKSVIDKEL